jgi:hypothetical protein
MIKTTVNVRLIQLPNDAKNVYHLRDGNIPLQFGGLLTETVVKFRCEGLSILGEIPISSCTYSLASTVMRRQSVPACAIGG